MSSLAHAFDISLKKSGSNLVAYVLERNGKVLRGWKANWPTWKQRSRRNVAGRSQKPTGCFKKHCRKENEIWMISNASRRKLRHRKPPQPQSKPSVKPSRTIAKRWWGAWTRPCRIPYRKCPSCSWTSSSSCSLTRIFEQVVFTYIPEKSARPVPDLVRPTPTDMIQDLEQKTREVFVMDSILAERMALLAPFGKGRNLKQVESGMLLAKLLRLAATFEIKAEFCYHC